MPILWGHSRVLPLKDKEKINERTNRLLQGQDRFRRAGQKIFFIIWTVNLKAILPYGSYPETDS